MALPGLAQDEFKAGYYWISFTDKLGTPYNLNQPEEFLSPRALSRRVHQGIALTPNDLPPNPAYIDSLKADIEVQVLYASRWLNGAMILSSEAESLERIRSFPFVSGTELVKPLPIIFQSIGDDQDLWEGERRPSATQTNEIELAYEDLFGKKAWRSVFHGLDPGYSGASIDQINGQKLLHDGYRGEGMLIAVLDGGFYAADQLSVFSHLWGSGRIAGTRDFVEIPENLYASSPHGTYVLSVMGGLRPGALMGTAIEATYWLIRTEDVATEYLIEEYNWLAGAELADSLGADVINSSLGYTRFDDPEQDHFYSDLNGETTVVAKAANKAFERGILVVNSAGNYGNQTWRYVGSPADSFGALSIGAVDIDGLVAGFSSRGPTADGRIKPDVMAHGLSVPVADLSEGVGLASGTSFSSPMIAGMSASLWGKFPHVSASQLKRAIIESGHLFLHPDSIYGNGIPDFNWASRLLQYDFQPAEQLVIYPNPISPSSFLTFHSESHQPFHLEVFDLRGQLVYSAGGESFFPGYNRIQPFEEMTHLDNGVYFLRMILNASGEFSVAKFIKVW
ncbi:MAG: S8 family serine peptidase [Bacteroides sp.]|nr:S8 family serine peptidase [Bacteroides sp.]